MYCHNCSNRLFGTEKYCPECGTPVSKEYENKKVIDVSEDSGVSTENSRSASVALGIISLVGVTFGIFAPITLVLSIIGLVLAIKSNRNVKNTVGIVLNSIALFLSFIVTSFIAFVIMIFIGIFDDLPNEIDIPKYDHGDPVISEKF